MAFYFHLPWCGRSSPQLRKTERLRPENLELQEQHRQQEETKMCHASWCTLECIPSTPRREEFKGFPWLYSELDGGQSGLRETQTQNNHPNKQKNPICTQNSLLQVSLSAVVLKTGPFHRLPPSVNLPLGSGFTLTPPTHSLLSSITTILWGGCHPLHLREDHTGTHRDFVNLPKQSRD